MCLHSLDTALGEEQERRAEAGRQVQLLTKEVSGELPTLFSIAVYSLCATKVL